MDFAIVSPSIIVTACPAVVSLCLGFNSSIWGAHRYSRMLRKVCSPGACRSQCNRGRASFLLTGLWETGRLLSWKAPGQQRTPLRECCSQVGPWACCGSLPANPSLVWTEMQALDAAPLLFLKASGLVFGISTGILQIPVPPNSPSSRIQPILPEPCLNSVGKLPVLLKSTFMACSLGSFKHQDSRVLYLFASEIPIASALPNLVTSFIRGKKKLFIELAKEQ